MDIFSFLKEMDKYYGITGNEKDIAGFVADKLNNYCEETWNDKLGNVFGCIPSKHENAKKLMITTHLDSIGLMVKNIDENGFLQFETLGAVDERILPASEVVVFGEKKSFGVIGAKAAHIAGADKNRPQSKEMLIDAGFKKETAQNIIQPGDFVALKTCLVQLLNNHISGGGLCSHSGIAAVFDFLEKVMDVDLPYDLFVVFTVGRESGSVGAYSAAYSVRPDVVVAVDAIQGKIHSKDQTKGSFDLGSGCVISRTPDVSYEGTLNLVCKAKEQNIPFEINASGWITMSDATAMQNVAGAVHTFLLSVPIRYMHQTVEMVYLDDISACSDLIYLISSGGVEIA